MDIIDKRQKSILSSLITFSLVAVLLIILVEFYSSDYAFNYFIWNLFLSWIPLLIAFRLVKVLRSKLWSSWEALAYSFIWLIFLPNSFYMISDLIHINEVPGSYTVLFAVAFMAIIVSALINGFLSVYLVQAEFNKRVSIRTSETLITTLFVLSSYGIYIGRVLRWNSWDVFFNPTGVLYDLSNQVINFRSLGYTLMITFVFFIFLTSSYYLIKRLVKVIH